MGRGVFILARVVIKGICEEVIFAETRMNGKRDTGRCWEVTFHTEVTEHVRFYGTEESNMFQQWRCFWGRLSKEEKGWGCSQEGREGTKRRWAAPRARSGINSGYRGTRLEGSEQENDALWVSILKDFSSFQVENIPYTRVEVGNTC